MAAPDIPAALSRSLLPTEDCVVLVRRHPAQLLRPFARAFALLVVLVAVALVVPGDTPYLPRLDDAAMAGVGVFVLWKIAEWRVDYFVVTDRRMVLTTGLLTRRVSMMPLAKVTDLRFDRPLAGRVLGYGVFVVESAGQDQALREVGYIPDAEAVYLDVCDLLFGSQDDADADS